MPMQARSVPMSLPCSAGPWSSPWRLYWDLQGDRRPGGIRCSSDSDDGAEEPHMAMECVYAMVHALRERCSVLAGQFGAVACAGEDPKHFGRAFVCVVMDDVVQFRDDGIVECNEAHTHRAPGRGVRRRSVRRCRARLGNSSTQRSARRYMAMAAASPGRMPRSTKRMLNFLARMAQMSRTTLSSVP
jgi:hypothetical protein